jgi:C-terminal processing protease CtpA/Prc
VAALTRQEMIEVALSRKIYNQAQEPPPGPDQVFEFYLTDSLNGKQLPTKVALLKLNSFNHQKVAQNKIKARKLYKKIFKYLEKEGIENLAIDLRDNSGGRIEFAHAMVPYLLPKDFESDTPLQTSYLWNGKKKTYKIPKRSRHAFTGNIYVLINGGTYSNASVLARFIKEFTKARLIGSESGSRYHGFTAGSKQPVNLPNSGLRIGVPRAHIRFPIGDQQRPQHRGVFPHNPIYYSASDYLLDTDLEMEYLSRVIKESPKQKQVLKN